MGKPSEKLESVLGFNPVKRDPLTNTVLDKVLQKVREGRAADAEKRAEEIITKALELVEKHQKTKKEFEKADTAFEKALGNLLNQLSGKPPAPEGSQEGSEEAPQSDQTQQ